jgi:hypothetical protein
MLMMELVLQIFNHTLNLIQITFSLDYVLTAASSEEWTAHGARAGLLLHMMWS